MTNLVMIPAFGCDERLYAEIAPLLPSNVLSSTVIADGADFAACVPWPCSSVMCSSG